jgi:hypothetical protein
MMSKINDAPVVTIALLVLATIVVVAGAVVTIVQPGTLSFHQYVQDVALLAAALGLGAGIGRGAIAAADRNTTPAEPPPPTSQDQ